MSETESAWQAEWPFVTRDCGYDEPALRFAGLRVARGSSEAVSIGYFLSQFGFYLGLLIGGWALHWCCRVAQELRVRQAKGGQSVMCMESMRQATILASIPSVHRFFYRAGPPT